MTLDRTPDRSSRFCRSLGPLALAAAVSLAVPASTAQAQSNLEPEEFTAFAINMGIRTGGTTASIIITVNRWSSEAEKNELFSVLRKDGQEALLRALQDAKRLGSLRTPETVGYDLRLAFQEPGKDGGRRVLIITDRPVGFGEASARPQSLDYPFTVIDMQLKPDGTGSGTMSVAAKIIPAGKTVLVENYDTQPVRLNRIESRTLSK
jgi:hypothetical protein